MRTLLSLLTEAKQVGKVYHYTSLGKLYLILENNVLKGKYGIISTTRDKYFINHGRIGLGSSLECRIELDGSKLSHKYKIVPYNYFSGEPYKHKKTQDEQEEQILTKEIPDITSYITKISIYDFSDPSKDLIDFIKEKNIPVEVIK